ncbi:glycosyltransferase family 41 protein [Synechococcus sp. FACHB-909]|uniref:O-linked N-acetylglucosamine transferase, SPINDLY family protein n=1 Tax=Synechococcus sp. FACHB-909 TaxID=2692863 RepID=UPI001685FAAC|nr:tetratricopeptide repeat protein [Synechococcus sp. FACHB-909]
MVVDSGSLGSVEHPEKPSALACILPSLDAALTAGGEQAARELSELFATRCHAPHAWLQLMALVSKHHLASLLPAALEAALRLGPVEPSFWEDCAKAVAEASEQSAADDVFRRALSVHPFEPRLVDAYGCFLLQSNQPDSAAELYASCLQQEADTVSSGVHERLWLHYAQALLRSGQNASALEALLQLAILSPGLPEVDILVATAFKNLGDHEQAIDYFRRALATHACPTDVVLDIGDCYNSLHRPDLAILEYKQALKWELSARERELLQLSLAQMHFRVGEHDASIRLYREILRADPGHVMAHYFLLISLSVVGRPQVGLMKATADSLWNSYRKAQDAPDPDAEPHLGQSSLAFSGTGERKTRIGILSAEIKEHVVAFFLTPFLENYDRSRFQVDLLLVCSHDEPRSRYLKGLADAVVDLGGLDQFQARQVVRDGAYDVVVETSGYLHSASLFILSQRCAPVQCHYIGFHATTGLDTMDYFIGDAETVPDDFEDDFSETLWRLPRPWLARSLSDCVPIAQSLATHEAPVFGCFSSLHKLNRKTLSFWGRALQDVPNSCLMIKDRLSGVSSIRKLIHDELGTFGIESSRVSFLGITPSWQEHMNHFNLIDIAFDTTPWSGATTAFDTLSMGVPLIGIRGDCTSARMSSSVLKAIGVDGWIAETPEEFAAIARQLAADYSSVRSEKKALQQRVLTSSLYDAAGLTRDLETCFETMVQTSPKKRREGSRLH